MGFLPGLIPCFLQESLLKISFRIPSLISPWIHSNIFYAFFSRFLQGFLWGFQLVFFSGIPSVISPEIPSLIFFGPPFSGIPSTFLPRYFFMIPQGIFSELPTGFHQILILIFLSRFPQRSLPGLFPLGNSF